MKPPPFCKRTAKKERLQLILAVNALFRVVLCADVRLLQSQQTQFLQCQNIFARMGILGVIVKHGGDLQIDLVFICIRRELLQNFRRQGGFVNDTIV